MRVISCSTVSPDTTALLVKTDDGGAWFLSSPDGDTPIHLALAEWFTLGGSPEPFVLTHGPIPDLTSRQIRLGLLQFGVTDAAVEAAFGALPPAERAAALVEWRHSNSFSWSHPLVQRLLSVVLPGMTDEEREAVWRGAAQIV